MTARVVISCDGTWDDGRMPCRGAFPTGSTVSTVARALAADAGWTWRPGRGDLCPAHTRIEEAP